MSQIRDSDANLSDLESLGFEILGRTRHRRVVRKGGETFVEGYLQSEIVEARDDLAESALRLTSRDTSRMEQVEGLVSGTIAAHSHHPSLHCTLLEDVPRGKISKSIHHNFEKEYWSLYTKLIAANQVSGASSRTALRAQVLSAAIAGVVHDAARKGTLGYPALEQELIRLVDAYLTSLADNQNEPAIRTVKG